MTEDGGANLHQSPLPAAASSRWGEGQGEGRFSRTAIAALAAAAGSLAPATMQFNLANYKAQPLTKPVADPGDRKKNGTTFSLAPGGRIDILVQAPLLPAGSKAGFYQLNGIVNLAVTGDPVQPAQKYPTDEQFPSFPPFLKNIGESRTDLVPTLILGTCCRSAISTSPMPGLPS